MSTLLEPSSSSLATNAVGFIQTLESYSLDGREILERAGIEVEKITDPEHRIQSNQYIELVELCLEETGDPCFGLRFADFVHPTTFHSLGIALLSSSTLEAFFRRLVRYYSFITTHEEPEFEIDPSGAGRLAIHLRIEAPPAVERLLIDGSMASFVRLIRFMYRPDWNPQKVELSWPIEQRHRRIYEKYLGPNTEGSRDTNTLVVSAADLTTPLPAANAELSRQNDQVVLDFLARMRRGDLLTQVRSRLVEMLPSGDCSKDKVAKSLFMSVRTLHNKLSALGTNYQEILDETRSSLAEQYMKQRNVSVGELAYLLGFSDGSNFSRAFRRWTGQSPTDYRERVLRERGEALGANTNEA